jgi:hypothetical protein
VTSSSPRLIHNLRRSYEGDHALRSSKEGNKILVRRKT